MVWWQITTIRCSGMGRKEISLCFLCAPWDSRIHCDQYIESWPNTASMVSLVWVFSRTLAKRLNCCKSSLPCKVKRQCLLTLQVSRCCLLLWVLFCPVPSNYASGACWNMTGPMLVLHLKCWCGFGEALGECSMEAKHVVLASIWHPSASALVLTMKLLGVTSASGERRHWSGHRMPHCACLNPTGAEIFLSKLRDQRFLKFWIIINCKNGTQCGDRLYWTHLLYVK